MTFCWQPVSVSVSFLSYHRSDASPYALKGFFMMTLPKTLVGLSTMMASVILFLVMFGILVSPLFGVHFPDGVLPGAIIFGVGGGVFFAVSKFAG